MGRLTTHVLDTSTGSPASGIAIRLYRLAGDARALLTEAVTNADGRCDRPVLEGSAFTAGDYELVFHAGSYFDRLGLKLPQPAPSRATTPDCRRSASGAAPSAR